MQYLFLCCPHVSILYRTRAQDFQGHVFTSSCRGAVPEPGGLAAQVRCSLSAMTCRAARPAARAHAGRYGFPCAAVKEHIGTASQVDRKLSFGWPSGAQGRACGTGQYVPSQDVFGTGPSRQWPARELAARLPCRWRGPCPCMAQAGRPQKSLESGPEQPKIHDACEKAHDGPVEPFAGKR